MGWDGSGNFTRDNGTNSGTEVWQDDAAAAIKIRADNHDTHDQDLADGIGACLTKNGETKPTADFLPNVDASYDIGSSSRQWVDGHFSNDVLVNSKSVITSDTVVTGHVRAGNMQIVNGSTDATFGQFTVSSSVTANTMETVGPTGGGASNTWSAMDQIPSNATILLVDLYLNASPNSTNDAQAQFFATDGDQTEGFDTAENRLGFLIADTDDTSGTNITTLTRVAIPLNSSRVFRCTWRESASASTSVILYYRGFMTD